MNYRELVTDFIRMLRDATGVPIGDNAVPDEFSGSVPSDKDYPYAIVYQVDGGYLDGPPLVRHDSHADIPVQVSSVGRTREQAHWMGDQIREAVLAQRDDGTFVWKMTPDVAGRDIHTIGGIDSEGSPPKRTFTYACIYLLRVLE